ncbi:MAG: ATP-binding protein [Christensenellales bacterium]|jgi:diphthine-ammonia ligase
MKFAISYSFGKDSALALYRMVQAGHQPVALLTTVNPMQNRSWIHGIQLELMQAAAQSLGLPLILAACSPDSYDRGLEDGLFRAKTLGAEACVFGDIDIEGHADYDRARCKAAGLCCELPLWQENREALLTECLASGFRPMIKTIQSDILPEAYLGQTLTLQLARQIERAGADICGENGEYHTFVYDGPTFGYPLPVKKHDVVDLGLHKAADIRLIQPA